MKYKVLGFLAISLLFIPGIQIIVLPTIAIYQSCTDLYEAPVISSTPTGGYGECNVIFKYYGGHVGSTVLPCSASNYTFNETIKMCYNRYNPKLYSAQPDKLLVEHIKVDYVMIFVGVLATLGVLKLMFMFNDSYNRECAQLDLEERVELVITK